MSEPFVSVVIPCFNTRDCVAHAINSALAQQEISVEVIVVDDGSTDGTPEFVRDAYAGDDRVRPFRMPVNGGPSAARNLGFRQARGTWTALLDSDDTWRENRLLRLLRHGHEADFIADNLMSFDAVARVETGPVYDDPHDRNALRYWDGRQWTPQQQRKAAVPPPPPPPCACSPPPWPPAP